MAHQPDGPLTGAPLSFPQEDVPTCAPLLGPFIGVVSGAGTFTYPFESEIVDGGIPNPVIVVDDGETSAEVTIDVLHMEDPGLGGGASLNIVEVIGIAGPINMPITDVAFTANAAPDFSKLVITFDTSNIASGEAGSLIISNDAGCSTQILIYAVSAP